MRPDRPLVLAFHCDLLETPDGQIVGGGGLAYSLTDTRTVEILGSRTVKGGATVLHLRIFYPEPNNVTALFDAVGAYHFGGNRGDAFASMGLAGNLTRLTQDYSPFAWAKLTKGGHPAGTVFCVARVVAPERKQSAISDLPPVESLRVPTTQPATIGPASVAPPATQPATTQETNRQRPAARLTWQSTEKDHQAGRFHARINHDGMARLYYSLTTVMEGPKRLIGGSDSSSSGLVSKEPLDLTVQTTDQGDTVKFEIRLREVSGQLLQFSTYKFHLPGRLVSIRPATQTMDLTDHYKPLFVMVKEKDGQLQSLYFLTSITAQPDAPMPDPTLDALPALTGVSKR